MSRTLPLALSAAAIALSAIALPVAPAAAQTAYRQHRSISRNAVTPTNNVCSSKSAPIYETGSAP